MVYRHLAALRSVGQIETCLQAIESLERELVQVPLWQPAAALKRQAAEARQMIAEMQTRLDRRLVVTLIGPSGAGKSTLLNALAGVDDLSPTGIQRPTTRELVVLTSETEAARNMLQPWGEQAAQIRTSPAAEMLEHVLLVDTPDTDSTQSHRHQALLVEVVERSDVLICVFDAQNPKRRDHADFMAPLVQRFHGASLVAVLNKCDRLDRRELIESIEPDFAAYLQHAWDKAPEAFFLVSARSHLREPGWGPNAGPRHDLDHYGKLRTLIFATFNQPGYVIDRRVANAGQIRDFLLDQTGRAAAGDAPELSRALEKLDAAGQEAMQQALSALRGDERRQLLGVHVRLYQALAQRWLGPVGWLVAMWSRLVIFGSGLMAVVRLGNPLQHLWGAISSLKRSRARSRSALAALGDQIRVGKALQAFRKMMLARWPDVAETLVNGGFDPTTRQLDAFLPDEREMSHSLEQLWADSLDAEIERSASRLSHPLLQILFNLPAVALLGYAGWLTATDFFLGRFLQSGFFVHALMTIVIVLLLSFFILQALVRAAVARERIQRRAFGRLEQAMGQRPLEATHDLVAQVRRVQTLARLKGGEQPDSSDRKPVGKPADSSCSSRSS